MYEIIFYVDKNGRSEVYEYIQQLRKNINKENKQKLKKIDMHIDILAQLGFSLKEPYIKKLDNDIWELRPLRERILFSVLHNNKIILLSVFMKQTQKTPRREIEKAKKLFKDYKRRAGNE